MIEVTITLHSARTGKSTELGRMLVINDGTGTPARGNYHVMLGRKGANRSRARDNPQRTARVEGHARETLSVWVLVAKALAALRLKGGMRYAGSEESEALS
jgi:hypothetical protein